MNLKRTTTLLGLLGFSAAIGAFVGCSSTNTTNNGTADSGTPTADGSVPTGDSAVPTDDAATPEDAGTDSPVVVAKSGQINLSQTTSAGPTYSTGAFAYFIPIAAPTLPVGQTTAAPAGCTDALSGTCNVRTCNLAPVDAGTTDAGTDAGTPVAADNAGIITISAPALPAAGITLTPDPTTGLYAYASGSVKAFAGGDTITFKAPGMNVPEFDSKTVAAPADLTISPALSYVTPTTIVKTADFVLPWTTGGAGNAVISLKTTAATVESVEITCSTMANANTVTVPAAALAMLQTTTATGVTPVISGVITVTPSNSTTFTTATGDYTILLTATGTANTGAFKTQ